jgi:ribonuclease HII
MWPLECKIMKFPTFQYETIKYQEGIEVVAGCDEVGVSPLAGPVVAAVAILDKSSVNGRRTKTKWWYRVRDSKTVSEKERETLVHFIKDNCLAYAVGIVTHETIDQINIYNAAMAAMKLAVDSVSLKPQYLFVDGNHKIKGLVDIRQEPVVTGDSKILSISAASIIAKVTRDKIMNEFHKQYPLYNFHLNKGYPTKFHREALINHRASPVHRRSFALVQQCYQQALPFAVSI